MEAYVIDVFYYKRSEKDGGAVAIPYPLLCNNCCEFFAPEDVILECASTTGGQCLAGLCLECAELTEDEVADATDWFCPVHADEAAGPDEEGDDDGNDDEGGDESSSSSSSSSSSDSSTTDSNAHPAVDEGAAEAGGAMDAGPLSPDSGFTMKPRKGGKLRCSSAE